MPAIFGGVLACSVESSRILGVVDRLVVALLAAATFVEAVIQRRMAQRRSICRMVALLVEHGAQLESSVLMTGRSMRGIVGRAANRLFNSLRSGTPLGVALSPPLCRVAERGRRLPGCRIHASARLAALRELSRSDQGELATIWRECVDRISYLGFVLVVMAGCVLVSHDQDRPSFSRSSDEFELELPAMTQLAFSLSEFVARYLAAPILLVFVLLTLAAIVIGIFYLCDVPVMGWFSDRFFRGQRTADVLRILALATEHRQPLADALFRVSRVYPSPSIRHRASLRGRGGGRRHRLARCAAHGETGHQGRAQPAAHGRAGRQFAVGHAGHRQT